MQLDPTKVQRALDEMSFPATRDELVRAAEHGEVDADIRQALESLPDELYNDSDAVLSTIEDQVA